MEATVDCIILDTDRMHPAHREAVLAAMRIPGLWGFKVGNAVLRYGLEYVLSKLKGFNVFVDLKHGDVDSRMKSIYYLYRDIDRTLTPPRFISVAGDVRRSSLDQHYDLKEPFLVVVPLRSDMSDGDCRREYGCSRYDRVEKVALKSSMVRVPATTCPGWLLPQIGMRLRNGFMHGVIATGTRSEGVGGDEHQQPVTPEFALKHGATHVVIGREITADPDPVAALYRLGERTNAALPKPGSIVDIKV